MAFWIKASLWTAVVVLPGGVLLLPVIYAVHKREQDSEASGEDASEDA